jgi:hypothetical protein
MLSRWYVVWGGVVMLMACRPGPSGCLLPDGDVHLIARGQGDEILNRYYATLEKHLRH